MPCPGGRVKAAIHIRSVAHRTTRGAGEQQLSQRVDQVAPGAEIRTDDGDGFAVEPHVVCHTCKSTRPGDFGVVTPCHRYP